MTAPSTAPDFATASTYTVDGDTWGGDPTKADPGSGRRAEGFEPDLLPAPWLNFMFNLFGSWLNYLRTYVDEDVEEFVYPSTKTRHRAITAQETLPSANSSGVLDWYLNQSGGAGYLNPRVNAGFAIAPIDLPAGCTITGVEMIVRSSTGRSTPNGWTISVWEQTESWVGSGITAVQRGATVEGGLSSGFATVAVTGLGAGFTMAEGAHAHVIVTAPTGSLGANDQLYSIRVTFTDGGPRNA